MTAGVQLTGMIQPSPDMIYDVSYEAGDTILPREVGKWTLFATQPIFTKDDPALPVVRDYAPGHPAPTAVQVTWLAANEEAYGISFAAFAKQQEAMQRAQALQQAKPKILIPKG